MHVAQCEQGFFLKHSSSPHNTLTTLLRITFLLIFPPMQKILDGISTIHSPFDILLIGRKGIGKSSLMRKYFTSTREDSDFDSSECLMFKNVSVPCACSPDSKIVHPGLTIQRQISILDSSSTVEELLTNSSYQVTNARTMLFAYCADSADSFESLEYMINCIESVRDVLPPCMIVSIKIDQLQMDQVSSSQGQLLADSCRAEAFVEVDLNSKEPFDYAFQPLIAKALELQDADNLKQCDAFEVDDTLQNHSSSATAQQNRSKATSNSSHDSLSPISDHSDTTKTPSGEQKVSAKELDCSPQESINRRVSQLSRNTELSHKTRCCVIV